MQIRSITPDTIDAAVLQGAAWAEQYDQPYDIESWRASVRNYAVYFDHYARLIQDNIGQHRGIVLGAVRQLPHTGERLGQLHYIYLDPAVQELDNLVSILQDFGNYLEPFGTDRIEIECFTRLPQWYSDCLTELGYTADRRTVRKGSA